jgi:AraC-like DNA-binding protein
MDPLSDILSLLKPRGYAFRGLKAGGDWAVSFAAGKGMKCYAVTVGQCWLWLADNEPPVHFQTGDVVLLARGQAFRMGSCQTAPPMDVKTLFGAAPAYEAVIGDGASFSGVGGYFNFTGAQADLLLGMLPPVVHFQREAERAALRESVQRLVQEMQNPQPGGVLLAEHLAQTLLIQALRLHLAEQSGEGQGWLVALGDRQMRTAIGAMHADPGRRWTLQMLADVAGMSRSSFAARFRTVVGEPPMDYLTRWRMILAADRLIATDLPISAIAPAVGYDSESAFGSAFKRAMGISPRRFARGPTAQA